MDCRIPVTYEKFVKDCKIGRIMMGPEGKATVKSISLNTNTCEMLCYDNLSRISIPQLIENVSLDGMGWISNPSALKKWDGWRNFDLWQY